MHSSRAYIIVSHSSPAISFDDPHPRTGSPTGAIVGGVVGGVAFIAICLAALFFFLRRRAASKRSPEHAREIDPFVAPPSFRHHPQDSTDALPTTPSASASASWRPDSALALPAPGTRTPAEKHAWVLAPPGSDHDRLAREVQELRQQVAGMRASRELVGAESEASVRPTSAGAEDADLRGELATLRAEMAWLRAETEGANRGEPPPAYA